jgi:hypothetical protein
MKMMPGMVTMNARTPIMALQYAQAQGLGRNPRFMAVGIRAQKNQGQQYHPKTRRKPF